MTEPKFKVGDRVEKISGYKFPGKVRSVFKTEAGQIRLVVESTVPGLEGMLHIYTEENLKKVE